MFADTNPTIRPGFGTDLCNSSYTSSPVTCVFFVISYFPVILDRYHFIRVFYLTEFSYLNYMDHLEVVCIPHQNVSNLSPIVFKNCFLCIGLFSIFLVHGCSSLM